MLFYPITTGNIVECMWMMLQYHTPEDFVIATGEMHSVREFCTLAFAETGSRLQLQDML